MYSENKKYGEYYSSELLRKNRPIAKKRPSVIKIIFIIIFITLIGVLIINNIIVINQLVKKNYELEKEYKFIKSINEALIAEINNKTSYENIIPTAEKELGMKKLTPSQVVWFELINEKQK